MSHDTGDLIVGALLLLLGCSTLSRAWNRRDRLDYSAPVGWALWCVVFGALLLNGTGGTP